MFSFSQIILYFPAFLTPKFPLFFQVPNSRSGAEKASKKADAKSRPKDFEKVKMSLKICELPDVKCIRI